jgi:4a-hydroxytetrahydrobiopterin dehydratase
METNTMIATRDCIPLGPDARPMREVELNQLLPDVSGWNLSSDKKCIQRTFRFYDFLSALLFANKIGRLAIEQGHEPDMAIGQGYCTVSFHTRLVDGLHENDFIMAAKVNELA